MKISKALLSAIAAGIVMTAATSCDKIEIVEVDRATTEEAVEGDRGNENTNEQCGTESGENCPACGMG